MTNPSFLTFLTFAINFICFLLLQITKIEISIFVLNFCFFSCFINKFFVWGLFFQ